MGPLMVLLGRMTRERHLLRSKPLPGTALRPPIPSQARSLASPDPASQIEVSEVASGSAREREQRDINDHSS